MPHLIVPPPLTLAPLHTPKSQTKSNKIKVGRAMKKKTQGTNITGTVVATTTTKPTQVVPSCYLCDIKYNATNKCSFYPKSEKKIQEYKDLIDYHSPIIKVKLPKISI